MNIHERLNQVLKNKEWSRYRLAKECELSESTITNIFKRQNVPTIGTLEIICNGLGITLSQFFAENDLTEMTPDLKEFYNEWKYLSHQQRDAILQVMKVMKDKK